MGNTWLFQVLGSWAKPMYSHGEDASIRKKTPFSAPIAQLIGDPSSVVSQPSRTLRERPDNTTYKLLGLAASCTKYEVTKGDGRDSSGTASLVESKPS